MTEEKKQSSEAVASEPQLSSEEGSGNATSSEEKQETSKETLSQINKATGRDYKSLDAAVSAIGETYKFVGKAGQKEEKVKEDSKDSKAEEPSEVSDKLPKRLSEMEESISETSSEIQELRFLKKYPEAEGVLEEVKSLASTRGETYLHAFENSKLPDLLAAKSPAEKDEKSTIATGKSQVGKSSNKLQELAKLADGGDNVRASTDLVHEILGEKLSKK